MRSPTGKELLRVTSTFASDKWRRSLGSYTDSDELIGRRCGDGPGTGDRKPCPCRDTHTQRQKRGGRRCRKRNKKHWESKQERDSILPNGK